MEAICSLIEKHYEGHWRFPSREWWGFGIKRNGFVYWTVSTLMCNENI